MRIALAALIAACCLLVPAAARAADDGDVLKPYSAWITKDDLGAVQSVGIDMLELRFNPAVDTIKAVELDLYEDQAAKLRADGIDLTPIELPKLAPKALRMALAPKTALAPPGDSPNPYYLNFRTYSEPGGIADQIRKVGTDHPDFTKVENIGSTTLGKPILVVKFTADARTTPDGTRPVLLLSAVNHARE